MKYAHITTGLLFVLFAIVQYNDPDFYIWIPVYSIIAFIAFSTSLGKPQKKLAIILTAFLAFWSFTFIPDLRTWINDGTPNIAGTMQAETPHIELMRELFGLILSILVSLYYGLRK